MNKKGIYRNQRKRAFEWCLLCRKMWLRCRSKWSQRQDLLSSSCKPRSTALVVGNVLSIVQDAVLYVDYVNHVLWAPT